MDTTIRLRDCQLRWLNTESKAGRPTWPPAAGGKQCTKRSAPSGKREWRHPSQAATARGAHSCVDGRREALEAATSWSARNDAKCLQRRWSSICHQWEGRMGGKACYRIRSGGKADGIIMCREMRQSVYKDGCINRGTTCRGSRSVSEFLEENRFGNRKTNLRRSVGVIPDKSNEIANRRLCVRETHTLDGIRKRVDLGLLRRRRGCGPGRALFVLSPNVLAVEQRIWRVIKVGVVERSGRGSARSRSGMLGSRVNHLGGSGGTRRLELLS